MAGGAVLGSMPMMAAPGRFRVVLAIACAMSWIAGACHGAEISGAPVTITVTMAAAPSLIVFRDGVDGDWQVPVATSPGKYEFVVHGPYTVEASCRDTAERTEILELARTPDDPRELAMPCSAPIPPPALHVTGTTLQPALVALGTSQAVSLGDEMEFDLAVDAGTFDLVAKTIAPPGEDQLVIRRDQVIARSTIVMPPIDATTERVSLVEVPLTITNVLPDDNITVTARLKTRSTSSALATGREPRTVRVLPGSALLSTDVQTVFAQATLQLSGDGDLFLFRSRSIERLLDRGAAPELALPAALDSLDFAVVDGQLVASWRALPAYDALEFAIDVFPRVSHRKFLSASYVDQTGDASATLDTGVPGYKSAWKIDLAGAYKRSFVARKTDESSTSSMSMLSEDANASPGL